MGDDPALFLADPQRHVASISSVTSALMAKPMGPRGPSGPGGSASHFKLRSSPQALSARKS